MCVEVLKCFEKIRFFSRCVAGSKSNMFVEDVTDGEGEEEEVIVPSITDTRSVDSLSLYQTISL